MRTADATLGIIPLNTRNSHRSAYFICKTTFAKCCRDMSLKKKHLIRPQIFCVNVECNFKKETHLRNHKLLLKNLKSLCTNLSKNFLSLKNDSILRKHVGFKCFRNSDSPFPGKSEIKFTLSHQVRLTYFKTDLNLLLMSFSSL